MSANMRIPDDVKELDDVGAAREILENLDFALDLLLLHGLEIGRVSRI